MSNMQAQLAEAREQAVKDQEALLKAMEQMHVKEDTQEDDQEHGGGWCPPTHILCILPLVFQFEPKICQADLKA